MVSNSTQPLPSVTEKGYIPAGIPLGKNCEELMVLVPIKGNGLPKANKV